MEYPEDVLIYALIEDVVGLRETGFVISVT